MSIYSTEKVIEENNYVAYLQSVGGVVLSHIVIRDTQIQDSINFNTQHINEFLELAQRWDNLSSIYNYTNRREYVTLTKDSQDVFYCLMNSKNVVIYDNSSMLVFDRQVFISLLRRITEAISDFYMKMMLGDSKGD